MIAAPSTAEEFDRNNPAAITERDLRRTDPLLAPHMGADVPGNVPRSPNGCTAPCGGRGEPICARPVTSRACCGPPRCHAQMVNMGTFARGGCMSWATSAWSPVTTSACYRHTAHDPVRY